MPIDRSDLGIDSDDLPSHLDLVSREDGQAIQCQECGATAGLRPLGDHDEDCPHRDETPDWVKQRGLDGDPHTGQSTLDGGVAKGGGR